MIETVDGDLFAGRVVFEGPDEIRVRDSQGTTHAIHPDDVAGRSPDLSAMPTNLTDDLNRRKMRDLIAFMASL